MNPKPFKIEAATEEAETNIDNRFTWHFHDLLTDSRQVSFYFQTI
jgi:hypothetical protein